MAVRKPQPEGLKEPDVDLAIAAIEGRPNPLDDPEMAKVHPDRTSLDLPPGTASVREEVCSNPRCPRPASGLCPTCGSPLCPDCLRRPFQAK